MNSSLLKLGLAAGACVLVSGCFTWSSLTWLSPQRPALPADCRVAITADPPRVPMTNIAVVRCMGSNEEDDCREEIRKVACSVGANTAYGLHREYAYRTGAFIATLAICDVPPPPSP